MPYRDPGKDVRIWKQKQGHVSLAIQASESFNPEIDDFGSEFTNEQYNAAIGLGATFDITDNIYARADFTRYGLKTDMFEPELDSATIGAGFRF